MLFGQRSAFLLSTTTLVALTLASPTWAGTLRGSVADASGTKGLQGAEVTLVETGVTTAAGPDGSFRFGNLAAGTYTVRVRFTGAREQTKQIEVPATGDVQTNFTLAALEGVETVLVIGQRANLLGAIARQRASDTVETVLTRDAIGQFPDQNVAESLRRAPGLNVLNDQGEGRFVSVRGLDPNLNSASINGNRILATGGDERAVALDVIPSELIESIEIKKTLTADMDGDTIGGSIDISTTSALNRRRDLFAVSLEGSYNDLNGKTSPKASLDFSRRIGDRLGIAGGLSYYNREFSTDNIEIDGWTETDDGVAYAEDVEFRDYDVTRLRYGGTLNLDFKLDNSTKLYARGAYSKFDDEELRRRLIFAFSKAPRATSGDTATFDSADGRIQVRRDLKDRREVQSIRNLSAGGRTDTGPWRFDYDVSWSEADQTESGSLDPVRFQARFQTPGALGVTLDYSDLQQPTYNVNFGLSNFTNPSRYGFSLLERTTDEDAKDKEFSIKGDGTYTLKIDAGTLDLKAGVRLRQREKALSFVIDIFDGYDGAFTLADVLGEQSYGLANITPTPSLSAVRQFVGTNIARFELNDLDTTFASNAENYQAEEDIYAGYVQAKLDTGRVRLIGGLRVEQTEADFVGNRLELIEEGATVGGVELDDDTLFITPVAFSRSYTDWLPSLNARFEVADKLVARAGVFRSVMRPSFGKQAPRFVIEENDENERSGEFGNPDLTPFRAWNFDTTLEYYFAPRAVVQGGLFYKKIADFIVDAEFENGTFAGIRYDEAVIPINGDEATVFGLELSYSQAFSNLAAPWDGLLVSLNYTYTNAEGEAMGRTIPLPTSSEHTFNAVLGYEKGPISLRAALAFRDGYLDELGSDAESDRYVKPHTQIDLTAKYNITERFQLFAELVNLNDATYTAYQRRSGRDRLLQFETYSWTGKFGIKARF